MKETKTIAKAANFTAADFGKLNEIKDYTLQLLLAQKQASFIPIRTMRNCISS
mgnify:CR=1 FL=1